MQLTQSRLNYLTKIFRNTDGVLVVGLFAVITVDGEFKVKLVAVRPFKDSTRGKTCQLLQTNCRKTEKVIAYVPRENCIPSPYNKFHFFHSQPTRAPSC